MEYQTYPIDPPKEKIIKHIMTRFLIDNIRMIPFTNVSLTAVLLDDQNSVCDTMYMVMDGADYHAWNGSDDYLIQWVARQIAG